MLESTPPSPLCSPADSLSPLCDAPDAKRPRLRRCRTSSSLFSEASKSTLALPTKTHPTVYLAVRTGAPAGGAFTPTPDAQAALQVFLSPPCRSRRSLPWPTISTRPVPVRADTIPSISRTASDFPSGTDTDQRSPPSPATAAAASLLDFDRGYVTPRRALTAPAASSQSLSQTPANGTPPALERSPRLYSARMRCTTCGVPRANFSACALCGQAWCSCARQLPGGVRHACTGAGTLSRTGISTPPVAVPTTPTNHVGSGSMQSPAPYKL